MQFSQIKTFVTVARLGHLTKAAGLLNLTQPAVSGQLKSLEDELNVKLLDRTPGGMVPTQAGRALLPRAEKILASIDEFRIAAETLQSTLSGQLRIGVIMIDPDYLRLGQIIARMTALHADVGVDLEVCGVQRCIAGVENGTLDGAFFAGESPHGILDVLKLVTLQYRIVAPASWAHLLENVSWSNLGLMPWIRAPKPSAHHAMVAGIFRHASIEPMRILEVDHESVIMSLVRAGVGLSVIREDLARSAAARGEVIVCEFAQAVPLPLSFIFRGDKRHDPCLKAWVNVLQAVWAGDMAARQDVIPVG
ncbi:LysR family transcriptional regulator [Paracandidimonas lactea]|uniref:LysR family transcriptional regulator n=1 Tax=Paracandidimonas lactea TaxID=2895524 RepID=UPI001F1D27C2|nr:LysR family transcriptional regulator [Paracandidimonas lactea]